MNLIDELFGRPKMKGKIIVEVDDDREKAETTIEGTFPTVLTMISLICSELHKHGIPKELIRGAVDIGFDEEKEHKKSCAGALTAQIKEFGKSEMQAVGAGALNQAVKAVAIARGFVAPMGINLVCIPAFTEVEIDNENKSAIKLIVREEK